MYIQHNSQTKRTEKCTDSTMVKRKGQKDVQTTQWSNEKDKQANNNLENITQKTKG